VVGLLRNRYIGVGADSANKSSKGKGGKSKKSGSKGMPSSKGGSGGTKAAKKAGTKATKAGGGGGGGGSKSSKLSKGRKASAGAGAGAGAVSGASTGVGAVEGTPWAGFEQVFLVAKQLQATRHALGEALEQVELSHSKLVKETAGTTDYMCRKLKNSYESCIEDSATEEVRKDNSRAATRAAICVSLCFVTVAEMAASRAPWDHSSITSCCTGISSQ
jgi:hypothetical protein